ncbi:MAG: hypothetical protein V4550_09260 [Gemmatimonadota bacterium]
MSVPGSSARAASTFSEVEMDRNQTSSAHTLPQANAFASQRRGRNLLIALALAMSVGIPSMAQAQWSTAYEQFYLPGKFNWTFRNEYPAADRLFAAFDYGHAILYERLYNDANAPVSQLESDEYDFITKKLLVSPPRLPLEEAAIEVNYAKIAPEAKLMFDWAHLLHRQIYDVLASENMTQAEKDAKIAELVAYYKTRPDLAFSSLPKNMELMEGQPYSLAFRQRYPKFNGLIWGYHWLQVGLYEPMMIGTTQAEKQAGVAAAVSRFRQMLENAPEHMPRVMPMTAAIAPTFAKRYQEAAIIFDNLHAMHDVISDVLANDKVPRKQKRSTILEAARRYRDGTSFLMPIAEWATMGEMMGIANMGGPAVGILPGWPTPTVARGASMQEAMKNMSGMAGMQHGATNAPMPGMPNMKAGDSSAAAHAGMPGMPGMKKADSASAAAHAGMPNMPGMPGMSMTKPDSAMMRLHEQMMRDPVIRQRVMADTSLRRMMTEMEGKGAAAHSLPGMEPMAPTNADGMSSMSHDHAAMTGAKSPVAGKASAKAPAKKTAAKKTTTKTTTKAPAKSTTTKKAPPAPMKHDMPGMKNMPGMKP